MHIILNGTVFVTNYDNVNDNQSTNDDNVKPTETTPAPNNMI